MIQGTHLDQPPVNEPGKWQQQHHVAKPKHTPTGMHNQSTQHAWPFFNDTYHAQCECMPESPMQAAPTITEHDTITTVAPTPTWVYYTEAGVAAYLCVITTLLLIIAYLLFRSESNATTTDTDL